MHATLSFIGTTPEFVATALLAAISPKLALLASNLRMIEPSEINVEPEIRMEVISVRVGNDVIVSEVPVEVPELRCGTAQSNKTNAREQWVSCPVCFDEYLGKSLGKVHDEGRWFRCTECKGKRGWWDDNSTVNAEFTTSGDNPVMWDQLAKLAQDVPRNFFELAPRKQFYSQAKFDPRFSGMHATNEEGAVLKALLHADTIEDKRQQEAYLRAMWKRFWEKHFSFAECAQWWLTPRAIKKIKQEFKKRGIVSWKETMTASGVV